MFLGGGYWPFKNPSSRFDTFPLKKPTPKASNKNVKLLANDPIQPPGASTRNCAALTANVAVVLTQPLSDDIEYGGAGETRDVRLEAVRCTFDPKSNELVMAKERASNAMHTKTL